MIQQIKEKDSLKSVVANSSHIPINTFDSLKSFSSMSSSVTCTSYLSGHLMFLHLAQIFKLERFLLVEKMKFKLKLFFKIFIKCWDKIMVSYIKLLGWSDKMINHKLWISFCAVRKWLALNKIERSFYVINLNVRKVC